MKKIIIIISVLLLLVVGYFVVTAIAENKIEKALAKEIEFEEVDVNLFNGEVRVVKVKYQKDGKTLITDKIEVNGFDYYQYLVHKKIRVDELLVRDVQVSMEPTSSDSKSQKNTKKEFDQDIVVQNIKIDGQLKFQQDSLKVLKVKQFNIEIDSAGVNSSTVNNKIPLKYKSFDIQANQVDYVVSKIQDISVEKISIQPSIITLNQVKYSPKYSREKYVAHIPYEKDLMDLDLKQLQINDYNLELEGENSLFAARYIELDGVNFSIYRDKTVKDDTREKQLYSKMLREMKLKLNVDSLKLKNSYLEYEELIKKSRKPGRIFFDELDISIYQLTNQNLDRSDFPETIVNGKAKFMGISPFDLKWAFRVNDKNDTFTVQGSSFDIPESSMNSFFVPAMGMRTEGTVNELFFNFKGNSEQARGELKIGYENFKIEALKKGSNEKNKFLSVVANLAVNKSSKNGQTITNPENVQRSKTKSFWNFFWKCIQAGLKEAIIKF